MTTTNTFIKDQGPTIFQGAGIAVLETWLRHSSKITAAEVSQDRARVALISEGETPQVFFIHMADKPNQQKFGPQYFWWQTFGWDADTQEWTNFVTEDGFTVEDARELLDHWASEL